MVNYPQKIHRNSLSKSKESHIEFANRGMSFEKAINATNSYYLSRNIAVIHKKPTPIQIVKVNYPIRSKAKITEAYFRHASTTDYSGVYNGYYIDFEAKETKQKNGMPMKNFHSHQIKHMEKVLHQKGICFALLHFSSRHETYLLPAKHLISFYQIDKGKKSMPLDYIKKQGYLIKSSGIPQIPYIDIIKKIYLGGD